MEALSHYLDIVVCDVYTFTVVYENIPLVFPQGKNSKVLKMNGFFMPIFQGNQGKVWAIITNHSNFWKKKFKR